MTDSGSPDPLGILWLTGTVGAGKTSVAAEVGRLLGERGRRHAVVDLDWLAWVHAGPDFRDWDALIVQNLRAIWPNFRALGVRYLIVARGVLERHPIDDLRLVFSQTQVIIVKLAAELETLESRLRSRDSGEALREHLVEAPEMAAIIDRLRLEDATVATDGRTIEEIALEVLARTGWI